MKQYGIKDKCPECGSKLTLDEGYIGSYWEPSQDPELYCDCGWSCEPDNIIFPTEAALEDDMSTEMLSRVSEEPTSAGDGKGEG